MTSSLDLPPEANPNATSLGGMIFVGVLLSLVPAVGAFLLYGIGFASIVDGNSKRKGAREQRNAGKTLQSATHVAAGDVVTVEGTILPSTTVVSPLAGETVALAVCCGYRQTSNVGNRALLFRRVLGGPLEIECGGRAVTISSSRTNLLSNRTKTETYYDRFGESLIGQWFHEVLSQPVSPTPQHTLPYEFEESLIMPGEWISATGVVSSVTEIEPGAMNSAASVRQRLIVDAPGDSPLELTTLSSDELSWAAQEGRTRIVTGVIYEVLAVASSVAWICFARAHGWFS